MGLIRLAAALAAASKNRRKTASKILIHDVRLFSRKRFVVQVTSGNSRVGIGYGDYGRGANRAAIRLTPDEADELVKAINASVDILRGSPPCGRAALHGYGGTFTPQERLRAELGFSYLLERAAAPPAVAVDAGYGIVNVGLKGDYDGRRCTERANIRLRDHEAEELVAAINAAVDALGEVDA